jgi:hypothetical protein
MHVVGVRAYVEGIPYFQQTLSPIPHAMYLYHNGKEIF